jgi:t-SNARE complex subunit (syntaxin)
MAQAQQHAEQTGNRHTQRSLINSGPNRHAAFGEEMEMAHSEFYACLSEQHEMNSQIDSVQKRVISATRPQIDKLQAKLIKEVNVEIDAAFQNAQDDLHLQQGKLTKTADEKLRAHNPSMDANAAGLAQADLRREAKLINHDIRDQHRSARNDMSSKMQPQTQPSTPETTNVHTKPNRQQPVPSTKPSQPRPFRCNA